MGNFNTPSVKIIVAAHKSYQMPTDPMYLPLHVGADINGNFIENGFDFACDNTGENISKLNSSFCELTGLYWGWKNLSEDYIGLVHYRRYLSMKKSKKGFNSILKYDELAPYLGEIRAFVPKKRKYYIESLYSHYAHTHYAEHLDKTKDIIKEKYPEYIADCEKIYKKKSGYMFNMMILEHKLMDSYCTWLFDILFSLQQQVSTDDLSAFQSRFYGRVSEILFNVWFNHQITSRVILKKQVMELPCIYIEKVNWLKKGKAFLKAKFLGEKYESSF